MDITCEHAICPKKEYGGDCLCDAKHSASLHTDIKKYLDQLAPHVKDREAAKLLQRVLDT